MPRRKKKPEEKKEASVRVRLTDEQKKFIEGVATRKGMDLSTFARVAMLEMAETLERAREK
jgi:uncharacterized protein (DUF1778 family)